MSPWRFVSSLLHLYNYLFVNVHSLFADLTCVTACFQFIFLVLFLNSDVWDTFSSPSSSFMLFCVIFSVCAGMRFYCKVWFCVLSNASVWAVRWSGIYR